MNIVSATSPVYSQADHSTIDVLITLDDGSAYPYTSAAHDNTDYGIQLWSDLNAGKYGAIAPYVEP